jgi:YD repeat-containing protein
MSFSAASIPAKKRFCLACKIFPAALACLFLLAAPAQAVPFANQWEWDNPLIFGKPRLIEEASGQRVLKIHYDQDGKRQKIDVLSLKGEELATMAFNYDKQGNLFEIQVYQPGNPHPFRETAQYENGRIVKMTGPQFPRAAAFEHDENGRLDKIIVLDDQGRLTPSHWLYRWSDDNKLMGTGFYALDGQLAALEEFEYNEQGFVSARNAFGTGGELVERREYEYTYDKAGNWTTRTTTRITYESDSEKKESAVMTRKISYY